MKLLEKRRFGEATTGDEIRRVINASFQPLSEYVATPRARAFINARQTGALMMNAPWGEWLSRLGPVEEPMRRQIGNAIRESARASIQANLSFDVVDAISVRYAREQAGRLIKNLSDTQQTAIRQIMTSALLGDDTVDTAAAKVANCVGLHPRHAAAVNKLHDRVRRSALTEGLSLEKADERARNLSNTYRKRLVKSRADMIARTEIQTAQNIGLYASWEYTIGEGLAGNDSRKEWDAGPGACPICAPLSGVVVEWNQPFPNGGLMPPGHPGCRCTANLLPPDYGDDELDPRRIDQLNPEEGGQFLDGFAGRPLNVTPAGEIIKLPAHLDGAWDWMKLGTQDTYGSEALSAVYREQGIDAARPTVLDAEAFERALSEEGNMTVYRGVRDAPTAKATTILDDFQNGDRHWAGEGIYGNGSYFSPNPDHALEWAGFKEQNVMKAFIKKDARFIEFEEVQALAEKYQNKLYDELDVATGSRLEQVQDELKRTQDLGVVAASHGYDGMIIRKDGPSAATRIIRMADDEYVLFNRSAIVVRKTQ